VALLGTVLVVDDHTHLAENLAEILEGIGYQVEVAGSAEAALARVERGVAILDYRLPDGDGIEVAELTSATSLEKPIDIPRLLE
jgi:CheY-like chemotaxis protein